MIRRSHICQRCLTDAVIELTKLREARGATQRQVAEAWEVTQANISKVEHTPDIFLSTLTKYVEALGGRLEITAVFPDQVICLLPAGCASVGSVSHLRMARDKAPTVMTLESLHRQRDEILRIAAKNGASNIRVFGSVAWGRARPDSDVDFLVEFAPDCTVLDLSSLILDLEEFLGREVDVVEAGNSSALARKIEQEAVPL